MSSRLIEKYRKEVAPALQKEFKVANVMGIPKMEKIVINTGIGKLLKDDKAVDKVERDLALISGQKPIRRKAKKSIAGFKIREGMDIGLSVTLRGKRMYDFADRLISIALPRSKDFRGIDQKNFDKMGNLNLGIKEQSIFSEITYETLKDIFSIQVTVVTTAKNRDMGIKLLKLMGFPIK
ncbi:MAG: 50S ribosomal protein L5 [Candidatus Yanofskybacteria bacterium GW2011_GWF1_44_227]|uniref:Large ribosomal subunit protein uL5 n=1 Tax=Candidatus Yanofskybacteria bacterium GW2011_GWE2_40_11 TaxID=1619033 RepID=A0A0G0QI72_9BACT|nr:MAG: 50S ribosomal protein L5 [Candidatus Yanofskybacteria bacterium GW2011_GWE1_40_10]KKR40074.1 MAG: 50S ribosomal protein L5 [Candidatus Yanofskybacteria bacterium GW2011_GWE2_40_11]KKT15061.1 MAG: 50S ribosomal protein L5 [Candidatus Yanofskybacteria bacterium GW2011_GWF2_43_596]KKT52862.1 MAG: 50S ribosomal protein L5 [Candidatus Yanofskybacteria bacterium GW2011_GWF1_44_227]OGN35653.1 MAG: 50S ribosomal protein L5 [Candidatus Yanofskybacteria bacterium RIFOXYA1_FULL_44_17]OGN36690.1 M